MKDPKENNYIEINRESWNKRTETHLTSEFYDVKGFIDGNNSLNSIELNCLGDLNNKKVLHLQCHFGQDTISMGRLGAHVTGADLSDKAILSARELAIQTKMDAQFICCDIYDLPNQLDQQFDIVFTSYGTIGWLPDLDRWAQIISHFLKPNGKLVFVEFHPVVWMFDDNFKEVTYNYFNTGPIIESITGTYTDGDATYTQDYVMWNHSLSEVINSLINHGLHIESFDEFDYSPYDCFKNTVESAPRKFRIKHLSNKIPMVYAIVAQKREVTSFLE